MNRSSHGKFLILGLAVVLGTTGCASWNNAGKGGAIGAGAGGVLGGVIGKQAGNTTVGILLGAAIGGTAGAAIGHHMDKQAAELQQDLKDARVERVGEGIKITFNSGILFDVDSDRLRPAGQTNITELSRVLQKYPDTDIVVQGHTDSTGSAAHNQDLSDRRANSVARELKTQGVKGGRIDTQGLGATAPVASNDTADGRQSNRRVEVAIMANDKMKKAAEKGQL